MPKKDIIYVRKRVKVSQAKQELEMHRKPSEQNSN